MKPRTAAVGCFGKVPSSSDFIRARANPPVIEVLDQWLAQTMKLLAADPRWKLHYDAMGPVDFAFVGVRRRHAIAGRLDPSRDQAGRRFPLLLMSVLEADGKDFLPLSPLALSPVWAQLGALAERLLGRHDPQLVLDAAGSLPPRAMPDPAAAGAALCAFAAGHSLLTLERALAQAGHPAAVRNLILALGLLMRPIAGSGRTELDNGLRLPLPAAPAERTCAAAFYLSLMAPFLARCDLELALFLPHGRHELIVGFSGAAPRALQALVDPHAAADYLLDFGAYDWVEGEIAADARLSHLGCLLNQVNLPLASAQKHFRAAFLGE